MLETFEKKRNTSCLAKLTLLKAGLLPISVISWTLGLSFLEYPLEKPRIFVTYFYIICFWSIYGTLFFANWNEFCGDPTETGSYKSFDIKFLYIFYFIAHFTVFASIAIGLYNSKVKRLIIFIFVNNFINIIISLCVEENSQVHNTTQEYRRYITSNGRINSVSLLFCVWLEEHLYGCFFKHFIQFE